MSNYIWLDCDPVWLLPLEFLFFFFFFFFFTYEYCQGHDDATAILLALYCTNIRLLGVSTVRCQYTFRAYNSPTHFARHTGTLPLKIPSSMPRDACKPSQPQSTSKCTAAQLHRSSDQRDTMPRSTVKVGWAAWKDSHPPTRNRYERASRHRIVTVLVVTVQPSRRSQPPSVRRGTRARAQRSPSWRLDL